jgi:hypothetical protein
MGSTQFYRFVQAFGGQALSFPAHAGQVGAGVVWRQVGNAHQVHAGGARNLRQVHGAEFARADQANADGAVFCSTLQEFGVQVHAVSFSSSREVIKALSGMPFFQGSSTG